MKLIYADSPNIDELTFKRLLLLGSELTFIDRPCIEFIKDIGTIGVPSGLRTLIKKFEGSPVILRVEEPPTTVFSSNFYQQYFRTDLSNPEFVKTVFDGIRDNWIYSNHFDINKNKAAPEFKDYRSWILNNKDELLKTDLNSIGPSVDFRFEINSKTDALFTFKIMLSEESLQVTAITHIANRIGSNPLSVNPYLNQLINYRLSSDIYSGSNNRTRTLGMMLFESLIPDEALLKIPIDDLIIFRQDAKDFYDSWITEINKLEAQLIKEGFNYTNKDIQYLIDVEINPRLFEIKNEIRRIRDQKFSNLIKVVKNNAISFIVGGSLSAINFSAAIMGFILTNLKTPKLTDDIIDCQFKLRDIQKSNGLTYLLKINELLEKA